MGTRHPLYQTSQTLLLLGQVSDVVLNLLSNFFLCHDSCFEIIVGVASMSVQEVTLFESVKCDQFVIGEPLVSLTVY